jgi:ribosome biogenesis GTPase
VSRRRLTDQQRSRIAGIQEERRQRMAVRAEAALVGATEEGERSGRVVVRHGAHLAVEDDARRVWHCLFRQNLGEVVCGDRVVWQSTGSDQGVVIARLDRSSVLSRPDYGGRDKALAANLSRIVVVTAPKPEPSDYLIDQYLVAAEHVGIPALIALNKVDLLDEDAHAGMLLELSRYPQAGYPLVAVSAKRAHGLDPLLELLRGQTSILVGQSGVGKSALVNALLPDREVQTGRLSEATGYGRHTTTAATLYHLPQGGELIDSPGVRSFRLGRLEPRDVEQGFREFRPHLGHCQFRDCSHAHEPGCAIRQAVEAGAIHPRRLENFLHLVAGIPPSH